MPIGNIGLGNIQRAAAIQTHKQTTPEYQITGNFGNNVSNRKTNVYGAISQGIIPTTENMQIAQEFLYNKETSSIKNGLKTSNPIQSEISAAPKKAGLFQQFQGYDGELHPVVDNQICIA